MPILLRKKDVINWKWNKEQNENENETFNGTVKKYDTHYDDVKNTQTKNIYIYIVGKCLNFKYVWYCAYC